MLKVVKDLIFFSKLIITISALCLKLLKDFKITDEEIDNIKNKIFK
jgi:hypothetical protein